jgi:hypothetical protein
MLMLPENHQSVRAWPEGYGGLLHDEQDGCFRSRVYGWDTRARSEEIRATVPACGAVWGFVARGAAQVSTIGNRQRDLREAEFFVTANGAEFILPSGVQLLAVQQIGFRAISLIGGPIEERGRLRYIDGCSDTVLASPPVAGNPCLNHLHFPCDITQTQHVHPSMRVGINARGGGHCSTSRGMLSLHRGLIFVISARTVHGFQTCAETMDVIAYHPDSDHGPRDEDHPMINRTLVNGQKLDNTAKTNTRAQVIEGHFQVDFPAAQTHSSNWATSEF